MNLVITVRQSLLFVLTIYVSAEAMSSHVSMPGKKGFIVGMYLRLTTFFDYVRLSINFYLKKT